MILKGTENVKRYPWIEGSDKMGIVSYGTVTLYDGSKAHKADPNQIDALKQSGYKIMGNGTSYIYVRKGV